jgi:hypothetical protein
MKASILSILSIATIWASNLVAQNQIPTGTWRSHFSYRNAKVCEASSKFIYSASENGFWRTSNIGEMTLLKKEDGFNGIEITCLKYNSNADVLVIGYADGNIDLLTCLIILFLLFLFSCFLISRFSVLCVAGISRGPSIKCIRAP